MTECIFYGGMSSSSRDDEEYDYIRALMFDHDINTSGFNSAFIWSYDKALERVGYLLRKRSNIILIGKSLGGACCLDLAKFTSATLEKMKTDLKVNLILVDCHTNFIIKFTRGYPIYNDKKFIEQSFSNIETANFFQHNEGLLGAEWPAAEMNIDLTNHLVNDEPINHENIIFAEPIKQYILKRITA